jgi:hypothetical protein
MLDLSSSMLSFLAILFFAGILDLLIADGFSSSRLFEVVPVFNLLTADFPPTLLLRLLALPMPRKIIGV